MAGIKNTEVSREVEKLLSPLKKTDLDQYNIIINLLDDINMDPTLGSERNSKDIEDRLYKMVDDHVKYSNANNNEKKR